MMHDQRLKRLESEVLPMPKAWLDEWYSLYRGEITREKVRQAEEMLIRLSKEQLLAMQKFTESGMSDEEREHFKAMSEGEKFAQNLFVQVGMTIEEFRQMQEEICLEVHGKTMKEVYPLAI